MRILFSWLFILTAVFCVDISAQKVRLRSQITPSCNSGGSNAKFADLHGDGNIAVQGSYSCRGAFIYDVTNPDAPVLASWYNPGNNQQFLEAIVVGNRGYFGSGNGGGVHIVDLTNPYSPQLLGIVNSANGNGHNSIHEMLVWGNYLIENYNSLSQTKILKFINISNPAAPVFVRDLTPTEPQWVHAVHVRGNRMFTSGWGNSGNRGRTEIYDLTNITTQPPTLLGFIEDTSSTTAGNNMHSSWSSEDGNYLYSCREVGSPDLRVYDIHNPAVPLLVKRISMNDLGLNAVAPHNPVVMGNYLYVSWYQAGIQVFDLTDPANPFRVGQYDTFPAAYNPPAEEKQALIEAEPWDLVCGSEYRQNALPTTYDGNWAVYPFLGTNKVLAGDLTYGLLILDASEVAIPLRNKVSDFDGDRKTDFSVFKPSTGQWQAESSFNGSTISTQWGVSTDKLVGGDYDGDGVSDMAVWRPADGVWYIRRSLGGYAFNQWGANGDIPVPGDYDADGKTDFAIWRPSTGVWWIKQSTLGIRTVNWGVNGDKVFAGDFEGDGKADFAVWRPSTGQWYIILSSSSQWLTTTWGVSGDIPLLADFDGDGRAEFVIYRPSETMWYIRNPVNNSIATFQWGAAGDVPIPADYDGDGNADIAIYRPSTNEWWRINSSDSSFSVRTYGQPGDLPSPGSSQPQ